LVRLSNMKSRLGSVAARVAPPPKVADSFYLSPEWRTLVADINLDRGAWCEDCGAGGRLFGDHIVEIKDGGAKLDARNVRLLCSGCHARKTAKAKAARARGETYGRGGIKSSKG
jgi:5-methylcytosine-specific restriction enzyme A